MPQMKQARNLKLGAIYVLKGTYEKVRLLHIHRQDVWAKNSKGLPMSVPSKHLLYANNIEVQNFLASVRPAN